jgi:hypothetical protein
MQEGKTRDAGRPESHVMKEPGSWVVQEGQRATRCRKAREPVVREAREPGDAGRSESRVVLEGTDSQVVREGQRARW